MALELLELEYRAPGVATKLGWRMALVESLAGTAFLVRERARLLLRSLADGRGEVIPVCAKLAWLENAEGGKWLGTIFSAIDAELDDLPLLRLAEAQPAVERCTVEAREEALRLLAAEFGEGAGG